MGSKKIEGATPVPTFESEDMTSGCATPGEDKVDEWGNSRGLEEKKEGGLSR